jgi:hypothetical protein
MFDDLSTKELLYRYAKAKWELVSDTTIATAKQALKIVSSIHFYSVLTLVLANMLIPVRMSEVYWSMANMIGGIVTMVFAPQTAMTFNLPNGEVLHFMDPAGNDACNGTSKALGSSGNCAWLTPNGNGALVCGDVIIAAAGNYTNNGIAVTRQPTGCTNGSTSGGFDGAGGIYVVYVLCATAFACVIPAYNGNGGQGSAGFQIQASNWAVEGWHVSVSNTVVTSDACFQTATTDATTIYHHVIFANNIASNCGYGFGVGEIGVVSTTGGVDYSAFLGDMTYQANQRNDGNETASFVFVNMANSDSSTTAVRSVMKGLFAINNNPGANGAPSDVEGVMRDTPQSHGTVGIDYARDLLIYGSGGPGLQMTNQPGFSTATPYTYDVSYVTTYGNNACTPYDPFNSTEVWFALNVNYAFTANYYNSISQTRGALGTCSGSARANYAFDQGATNGFSSISINVGGTGKTNYLDGIATFCTAGQVCDQASTPISLVSGNGIPLPTVGNNVYHTDPGFQNTTDLWNNHLTTLPNCVGFETIAACLGWNFATQTASVNSVIYDLTPTTAGAVGKGYRPPAPCAPDPGNLHPAWLKGFGGYLFWTGSSILYKPGYINAPCGT